MMRVIVSGKVINIYKSTVGRDLQNHHLKELGTKFLFFLSSQTAFTILVQLSLYKNSYSSLRI
jgi:hypothetical protein